jgi:tetratricopeptide (TPR) repeat protein
MEESLYVDLFLKWEQEKNVERLKDWESEDKQKELNGQEKEVLGRLFALRGETFSDIKEKENAYYHASRLLKNSPKEIGEIIDKALKVGKEKNSLSLLKLSFELLEKEKNLDDSSSEDLNRLSEAYFQFAKRTSDQQVLEKGVSALLKLVGKEKENSSEQSSHYWRLAESFFLLGEKSGEAVDYFKALKNFSKASSFFDTEWQFCLLQGICFERLYGFLNSKDYLYQAKECFEKAFLARPEDHLTTLRLSQCLITLYQIDANPQHFDRAEDLLHKVIASNTDEADFFFELGRLLLITGKCEGNIDKVENSLYFFSQAENRAISKAKTIPYKIEVFLFLGCEKEDLDLLKKVECFLDEDILAEEEDAAGVTSRVKYLISLGDYFGESCYFHEAIGRLKEHKEPHGGEVFFLFSQAYYELYLLSQSLTYLAKSRAYISKAVQASPNNPNYWGLYGCVLSKLGESEEEQELLREANDKFEKAIELRQSLCYFDLCWICDYGFNNHLLSEMTQSEEDLERVVEVFTLVLSIESSHLDARYHLAQALLNLGALTSDIEFLNLSVEHYRLLLEEDSEDDMALNDLGEAYISLSQILRENGEEELTLENLELAEESLLQAVVFGNTDAFYNLACLFSLKGAYEETLFYLQRALSADSLPSLKEIMEDDWLEGFRKCNLFKLFYGNLA